MDSFSETAPKFVVVRWVDEEESLPDIISNVWLKGRQQCYFPLSSPEKKMRAHAVPVKEGMEGSWQICNVKIVSQKGIL